MKENFPNLVKEIDMQVQEAHRVSNKVDTEHHQDISKLKCQRLKIKNLKSSKKKAELPTKEFP